MRERDPENLTILQKWAVRDLFTYVPFRTYTNDVYTWWDFISERQMDFCPQITDIIPMLSKSQQYLSGIIFHLSEKKYYTMDPTHQYHGDHATGYFYDNLGQNIQDEFEEQLRLISEISTLTFPPSRISKSRHLRHWRLQTMLFVTSYVGACV